jgi:hypothetical protein
MGFRWLDAAPVEATRLVSSLQCFGARARVDSAPPAARARVSRRRIWRGHAAPCSALRRTAHHLPLAPPATSVPMCCRSLPPPPAASGGLRQSARELGARTRGRLPARRQPAASVPRNLACVASLRGRRGVIVARWCRIRPRFPIRHWSVLHRSAKSSPFVACPGSWHGPCSDYISDRCRAAEFLPVEEPCCIGQQYF